MARALKLEVTETNVFGEPPVSSVGDKKYPIQNIFKPSRGVTPSFGERVSTYTDGDCYLYMMVAEGDICALHGAHLMILEASIW